LEPLDTEAIVRSVKKTGRLIVVDEDYPKCGMASEIAAIVSSAAFDYLDHPITRVTAPLAHVPFSSALEPFYLPRRQQIVDCAIQMRTRASAHETK
jgi:pyruvate dehydrogenase E1 component beta subunit